MANTAPSIFTFTTQSVRVIVIDDAPWFVAADICEAINLGDTSKACSRLDDDEKGTNTVRTPSGDQQMLIINESGLYSLILTSRKPEAKKFKKWVTSEVLPAIRKTGSYTAQPEQSAKPALPPPPKRQIKTRDDLSFTQRDAEGRLINWAVQSLSEMWSDESKRGEAFFAEVSELAQHSETEAYNAVRFALSGREWPGDGQHWQRRSKQGHGWGAEDGFAEAIARAVIDGLRARNNSQEPFDPEAKGSARRRKALPKPKRKALPSLPLPLPAQQAFVLH